MKKSFIKQSIIWSIIAIGLFLYYQVAHPLYVFTVDDWLNIVNERHAYPYTSSLNPGKVLPETLFPLIAELARWLIYPITHDFIGAITLVSSVFLTSLTVIYFYQIVSVASRNQDENKKLMLLGVLVVLHFYIYKNSQNMFSNNNLTDVFHYIIPYMINVIAVCHFIKKEAESKVTALDFFILYISIFSNMFQNIILVTYCFFRMIQNFVGEKDRKTKVIIKKNSISIICFMMWIIDLYVERNGKRADQLQETNSGFDLIVSVKSYLFTYGAIRKEVVLGAIILCVIALIVYIRKKGFDLKKNVADLLIRKQIGVLLFSFVCTSLYIILLDSYINSIMYLRRTDVYNTILIYPILIMMIVLSYVIENIRPVYICVPIVIYCMLFQSVFHSSIFGTTKVYKDKKSFCDQVISEMIEADQNNEKEILLTASKDMVDDASEIWLENAIPRALYAHGIVSDWIRLDFEVVEDVNQVKNNSEN